MARIVDVSGRTHFHASAHERLSQEIASIRGREIAPISTGSIAIVSAVIAGILVSFREIGELLPISSAVNESFAQIVSADLDASSRIIIFSLSSIRRAAIART